MLIGITTGGKLGLGITALVFVAFALGASFLLPRRNPNFPGEHVGRFVGLTVLLFIALMAAVIVFAKEGEEEAAGSGGEATETQPEAEPEPVEEQTVEEEPAEEEPTEEEPAPGGSEGDAAAGEAVFSANGCGGCHTLEAAGSSGNIGPNLDEAQPDLELAVERVTNGQGAMPSYGDELSEEEIRNVAAYVVESTSGG